MDKKIGIKQEERGIPFEFIKENVQTVGDLKKISEKIEFYKQEQLANENISKIFNPKEEPYKKAEREILNSIFGENFHNTNLSVCSVLNGGSPLSSRERATLKPNFFKSVIKKQLNNST